MLSFSKLVGTGNDFIYVDLTEKKLGSLTKLTREQLAQKICDRHFGVGADGIIYVEKAPTTEKLKWDFYNRDGSQAEFCGNAARCFGRWAHQFLKLDELIFESRIGDIRVLFKKQKNDEVFVVQLHSLSALPHLVDILSKDLISYGDAISKVDQVYLVNTGVPHFVCVTKSKISREEKYQLAGAFRFHPSAGLAGANVTFLFNGETETFERGVEDFTLSCGTGVIAAAVCVWKKTRELDIILKTPGGSLRVEIVQVLSDTVSKANLIGPAEFICEGNYVVTAYTEAEKT
jgi:diaminopimelate epimerase